MLKENKNNFFNDFYLSGPTLENNGKSSKSQAIGTAIFIIANDFHCNCSWILKLIIRNNLGNMARDFKYRLDVQYLNHPKVRFSGVYKTAYTAVCTLSLNLKFIVGILIRYNCS